MLRIDSIHVYAFRSKSRGGLRSLPHIVEMALLDVIEELIVRCKRDRSPFSRNPCFFLILTVAGKEDEEAGNKYCDE